MPSALAHLADWPLFYPTRRGFGKFPGEVGVEGEEDMATMIKSDIRAEAGLHFSLPSGEMNREDSSQNRNYIHHCTHPSPGREVLMV